MTIITYLFLGFITAIIGALPLGTTNVAVINTTIKENIQSALKIVYTAALAELILVLIALNFNMQIENFVDMNIWIQYGIAVLLLLVGIILILGRKECVKDENEECIIIKKRRFQISKQTLGFILGLVNPTVLIYWILVISFLNNRMIYFDVNVGYTLLILFIIGVFSGKVITLYGYGKFSHMLKVRMKNITTRINRVIGVLLVCISIFQFTKLFYY
ncbi:LysE family transporter [Spongiivirga citrea]|uniref:LysE family transporter n=1 Tax=Spongiivirga citrea TaxID=1481457 RepID=A0A6M0CF79_9FLAO|nr:LysE family transporter [Spongiivirga citrea]NER16082.1 LysE family transporter [Spongiivirga citrea]